MSTIANLERMLKRGQDSALLRYSLGNEYLKTEDLDQAVAHLVVAVQLDPNYSAAWKLYGKTLAALNRPAEAIEAFDRGIAVAERKGDLQAAKEMQVFRRRAQRTLGSDAAS